MQALFLQVLNMSVTASYVILVVVAIRLLLKRAPKRYSYLLWSVVLYRLVNPASFASVVSLFSFQPFQMATAQRSGAAVLSYVPADVGRMQMPTVTVGIPAANSLISQTLPKAAPLAGTNPLQHWVALAALVWCIGVLALLFYSLVTCLRLHGRLATAVRLDGNVFETDEFRSPFILGLIHPRIFIPIGLAAEERTNILRHEQCHLRRKDHLLKPLCFGVLTAHWFNPLAWLAFALMSRDMEMSCDERVLIAAGPDSARSYSKSLLSLATNRPFPAATPLAFGETGIRERVLNILRFKQPRKGATIFATLTCLAVATACAANPLQQLGGEVDYELYGSYLFEQQIYMHPLSSFLALDGYIEYYTFSEDGLILTDQFGNQQLIAVTYEQAEVDEQAFRAGFDFVLSSSDLLDISAYKQRQQFTLKDASGSAIYRVYRLDDELWLARLHQDARRQREYIWSIYRITEFDGEIPARATVIGTEDGVAYFLSLQTDFRTGYDRDTCYNITPAHIQVKSGYSVFKYDASCASFLLYQGEIHPMGIWTGGLGVTSMLLADLNKDGQPELYFTFSFGSGMHRSLAAYFDPVVKQVVTLDYTHLHADMLLAYGSQGQISLYEATVSRLDSFVDFQLERNTLLADIVYEDGNTSLQLATDR